MSNYILEKATYYYYGLLNDREKELYKSFLYALLNMKPIVEITEVFNSEQVKRISRYIINDRPDIFWYRGEYVITTRNNVIIRIEFHYVYTEAQKENIIHHIENSPLYKHINLKIKAERSDFEKALKLYELIIQNTEYEKGAVDIGGSCYEYAYGLEGVILKHRAVCAGYSKAFQYFANKHNIQCTIVTGQTKRSRHAWNLVNLYGNYYYIDTTWGDPTFSNVSNKDPNYISYDYFCITTEELKLSHQPIFDDPMPLCTATKYNYYEFFGLKETSYSVENIAKHIIDAARKGNNEACIKYSTQAAYQTAVTRLFQQSEIFEALRIASRYVKNLETKETKYNLNDTNKIITIKL